MDKNGYCLEDPDVYLQGTRNNQFLLKDHAYVIFEILKCHEDTREEGDPECAEMEDINSWLRTKAVQFRMIDNKIDFNNREEYAVRQTEIYMPMITLEAGHFSDTGYRFRKNTFFRVDEWYPFRAREEEEFYDVTRFNSDTFLVEEDGYRIAELYFRLETEEVTHHRTVK